MGAIVDPSEVLLELGLSGTVTDEERAIAVISIQRAEGAVRRHLRYDPTRQARTEFYPQSSYDYIGQTGVWETSGNDAVLRRLSEAATDELLVKHVPIRASTAMQLWIDYDGRSGTSSGAFAAESLKTEGTDYWPNYDGQDSDGYRICRDGLIRSIGQWPTTAGTVKITYTAGYTDSELHGADSIVDASPIWDAVLDEAVRRVKKALLTKKHSSIGWIPGLLSSETLGSYSYSVDSATASRLFGSQNDLTAESLQKLEAFVNWGYALAS